MKRHVSFSSSQHSKNDRAVNKWQGEFAFRGGQAIVAILALLLSAGPLSAQTRPDTTSAAAKKLLAEANALVDAGSEASLRQAIAKYESALALSRSVNDRLSEGAALNNIGRIHDDLGERQKALDYFNQALLVARELNYPVGEATTLNNIGLVYSHLGETRKALNYYERALALRRASNDRRGEVVSLNNIGLVYDGLGERQKALDYFNQALLVARDQEYPFGEATILNSIGLIYSHLGEKQKALNYYEQALVLRRALRDRNGEATTLSNIGALYDALGEREKALDYYRQALPLIRAVGDRGVEGTMLSNLGAVYNSIGENQKALDYYNEALALHRAVGDRTGEATTLNNIGHVYDALGEKQKGLDYYDHALKLLRAAEDRTGEATTLSNIGAVYDSLGDKRKALGYYNQALPLRRAVGDRTGEATTLNNIGHVYDDLGEKQKSLDYYDRALKLSRAVEDRTGEALTLSNIGAVYDALGEKQKALGYYNQALPLQRAVRDRTGEARTLNNIGRVCDDLGEKQKALDYYHQALPVWRVVEDRTGEAQTLSNIGVVYDALGERQKALNCYNQALPLQRAVRDRTGEARTLNNIGGVFHGLGEKQKALDYYHQALTLWRAVEDRTGEALTFSNIGVIYDALGDRQKALDYFNQALLLQRAVRDRTGEARTLNNIGGVYYGLGETQKTLDYYNQALPLWRAVGNREGEALTLGNLMVVWEDKNVELAIFYGKQAVNSYQQLRANISGLETGLQKSFLHSKEDAYRILADLLISKGRLPEAQQVLGLLKEQEYFDFVRRDSSVSVLLQRSDLTPAEEAALKRYDEVADNISKLAVEFSALKSVGTPPEDARYQKLQADIEAANRTFQVMLRQLADEFGQQKEKARDVVREIQENRALQSDLKKWGNGTVSLYTIAGAETYRVILTTPTIQVAREATPAIKAEDLNKLILQFREAVQNPSVDPRPLGLQLYRILIAPMEKDLEAAGAKTLLWSLDGTLRYLPIAALHDGQRYLVERYQNVIITLASRTRFSDQPSSNWRGLGLGVSKQWHDLRPLLYVPEELHAIIREGDARARAQGIVPGTVMLDKDFTQQAMQLALNRGQYPLVHIASHFQFKPGNEIDSFLLLGDGSRLTLDKIRVSGTYFEGVELLTLSACDTATGGSANGKEVEGFAVLAQQQGAQAVLATLWPVLDESTKQWMERFYQFRMKPGITKAEAVRQAQLSLLHPQTAATGRNTIAADRAERQVNPGPFKPDPKEPFAHPYFWAPFILVGNWR